MLGVLGIVAGAFSRFDSVGPLTYLVAFVGGFLSFLSPCVLPLVPGYLSVVTGLDLAALSDQQAANRRRVITTTSLFILGFAVVYVPIGAALGGVGSTFSSNKVAFTRFSGVLLVAFALFMIGSVVAKAPWLYQELRFHPRLGALGKGAPVVVGAAFAFGWTPCVGPVSGSIITIAAQSGRAWTGAALLLVYTLGLGIPFLIVGLSLTRMQKLLGRIKRHLDKLVLGSAALMLVFGMLLVTNQLSSLNKHLSNFLEENGMSWVKDYS